VGLFYFADMEASHYTSIKHWAKEDRPREKLLIKGKNALSDAELLAILISTGTRKKSAIDLARELLSICNNDLNQLARMSVKDLMKQSGIGAAKAIIITTAIELGGRRQSADIRRKNKIGCSKDAYELMRGRIADLNHEEFWILYLNRANQVICEKMVSEGGISGTVADPKKIYRIALEESSSGIIACHNHPSGNLTPSQADNSLTNKLKESGSFLDIPLIDHLIIGQHGYYSYADEGAL